jgi:CBS domain-containing protein
LTTDPDFTTGHIDNSIRLVLSGSTDAQAESEPPLEVSLKVGNLKAASQDVLTVGPTESLDRARTLMILKDYSQLAVASSPRSILGAISWESIGRRAISNQLRSVRDATVAALEVHLEDDLLPLLPRVADAGYVLVRARDNTLSGIITAADVTEEFDALASPFLLLGELERRLRLVLTERFEPGELAKYRAPEDGDREIAGPDDLSLGEIVRLLEREDAWDRLGWSADRTIFIQSLHEVRVVRNRLMHFSPDLPTSDEVMQMRNMLAFLKLVTP